jgi:hypothetical protein
MSSRVVLLVLALPSEATRVRLVFTQFKLLFPVTFEADKEEKAVEF